MLTVTVVQPIYTSTSDVLGRKLPLSWAGALYPWDSWRTIVPLVIGAVVLVVFVWYDGKPAEAMVLYRIFANRTAASTLIGSFIHGMVLVSMAGLGRLPAEVAILENPN